MPRVTPPITRFLNKVGWGPHYNGTRCMLWQGALTRSGYGSFSISKNQRARAHRWLYQHWFGAIPDGLELDHLCRTPSCVNPAHLEPVTHQENVLRGIGPTSLNAKKASCGTCGTPLVATPPTHKTQKRMCPTCTTKTHCKNGHEFVEGSYRVNGCRRTCLACLPTHCVNGHEYTPENTITRAQGHRQCKTCTRASQRESWHRLRRGAP